MTLPDWTTLVSPQELLARLGDPALVVLDARFSLADPGAGEAAWRESHLPGARYVHPDRDLSGAHTPGAGRHPWPEAASFGRTLGRLGITPAHQVVVYDAADGAFAARAWCLLRMAGHARVAVLDGGFEGWRSLGLPLDAARPEATTEPQPEAAPAPPYPVEFDRARLFDAARVQAHLETGGLLLDARAGERFRGEVEPIDARAGHVPGATSRPYADNLAGSRFKSREALAAEFGTLLGSVDANARAGAGAGAGAGAEDPDRAAPVRVVAMCGSGVTACHHLLAMAHAGLEGAGLYAGSWSGWIEDPARPVATGPG